MVDCVSSEMLYLMRRTRLLVMVLHAGRSGGENGLIR